MAYHVRTSIFDGPFDLLLNLVSRQKVNVASIQVADLADQYLREVEALGDIDLDVASDFMEVAASLLAIKARSVLPQNERPAHAEFDDELDEEMELSPANAQALLVERLLAYRQFRQVAAALEARGEREARMHPRVAGPDPVFLGLMPDFLKNVTLEGLGALAAQLLGHRQAFLLEADHVAPPRPPVALTTASVDRYTQAHPKTTLSELLGGNRDPQNVVVTFLALLELYKLGSLELWQKQIFGEISVQRLPDAKPYVPSEVVWEVSPTAHGRS